MDDLQLPNFKSVRMELVDAGDGDGKQPVKIAVSPLGATVYADNHSTKDIPDRPGVVVWIGFRNGELRVLIWGDISQQDPTHDISLESARVDRRSTAMADRHLDR